MIKKIILSFFAVAATFLVFQTASAAQKTTIYFFWGEGCPHCSAQKPFLEKLAQSRPQLEIKSFEIYNSKENQELFDNLAQAYGTRAAGVPMTFIGTNYVVGFGSENTTGRELQEFIDKCLEGGCPSPEEILEAGGIAAWEKSKKQPVLPNIEEKPDQNLPAGAPEIIGEGQPVAETASKICIHYFVKDQCGQCRDTADYLAGIAAQKGIDFKTYNVSENGLDSALYEKMKEFYGISFSGFPIVFLGDVYLVGDDRIRQNIEPAIDRCRQDGCPCPVEEYKSKLTQMPKPESYVSEKGNTLKFDLFGKSIEISAGSSLFVLALILGLADGINPCMFSVLLFLLTYLLAIGSKKKAVKIGLVFTAGVFAIYFLFMLGMINLISLFGYIQKIKIIVAAFALFAGAVMIKDFFAYGKWFSLEIPAFAKPAVEKLIKRGTVPSAIILALLSSLVELPCTAGIPLMYITILAQKGGDNLLWIFFYNLFFILPLLFILLFSILGFSKIEKMEKTRENTKKYMRLAAGLILVFLAVAFFKGWM